MQINSGEKPVVMVVLRTFTVLVAGFMMMRSRNLKNFGRILMFHIADLFRFA